MNSDLSRKVSRAIRLLRSIPQDKGDIELSYSGGKDSDVILELAKMADIPFRAIYKNTTIDPVGTIRHCIEKGAEIVRPDKTFFQLIRIHGLPSRFARFCCKELKEYKICDTAIQGIRRCESRKRAERYKEPQICRFYGNKNNRVSVFMPILDWTDADVQEFVAERGIKCHPLYYNSGQFDVTKRLGCVGCPLQSRKKRIEEFKKHPKFVRQYIRNADVYYKEHSDKCKNRKYNTAVEAFAATLFFDSYEDFLTASTTMFEKTDWKRQMEEFFNVSLDF